MDEHEEQVITARLRAGDIHALTSLVIAYQHRALRTAYLITQDRAMAEDVTQSAFLRAFDYIKSFDPSRRFLPWFLRIVANLAVQAAQKQPRSISLDAPASEGEDLSLADLLSDDLPNPETLVEMQEREADVQRLLERLSPEQRAVIVLRYYADFSEDHMAQVLAVPAGTIKSRLHTARKHLRGWLSLQLNPKD